MRQRTLKKQLGFLGLVCLVLLLGACKKNSTEVAQPEPVDTTTTFSFEKPRYLPSELNIPADNPTTTQGVDLGRMLFFDTQLSANGTIACASCHKPELAFTDGRASSIGINGSVLTRSSMGLSNKVWDKKLMWDGRHETLEELIHEPLTSSVEMAGNYDAIVSKIAVDNRYKGKFRAAFGLNDTPSEDRINKALSQFMRSLQSLNSNYDKELRGEYDYTPQEARNYSLPIQMLLITSEEVTVETVIAQAM
jgi:cytochrome c peroxidase